MLRTREPTSPMLLSRMLGPLTLKSHSVVSTNASRSHKHALLEGVWQACRSPAPSLWEVMVRAGSRRWRDATKQHLPFACSKVHVERTNTVVRGLSLRIDAFAAGDQTTPPVSGLLQLPR